MRPLSHPDTTAGRQAGNPLESLDLDLDAEPGTSRAVLARRVEGTKHLLAEATWSITVLS